MTAPSDKTHKPEVCDNQHSELKRLAELRLFGVNSAAILALIAENKRLKADADERQHIEATEGLCFDRVKKQRDEAVALLRANMMYPDDGKTARETQAFLARIDAAE